MGDVNGVGPEIIAKAFASDSAWSQCRPIIFGSAQVYDSLRAQISGAAPYVSIDTIEEAQRVIEGHLPIFNCATHTPKLNPGMLDPEAGRCAMEWVERATHYALAGDIDGIVTCPINKQGIHDAGYTVQGHTDYIAQLTDAPSYRMCLFTDDIGIVHLTGHLSLRDALNKVRKDRIEETIRISHEALVKLGKPQRRIAVAGLNPHAGEAGAFGSEEIDEIAPAIEACRAEGIDCTGPHSPDAVFRQALDGAFDIVVALYHDQGHIPLKLVAMDEGVNVTLGLPIVRTSVDHGTAYDIAGQGIAREDSLRNAINMAAQLVSAQPGVTP